MESLVASLSARMNGVNFFMADIDHTSNSVANDIAMRWADSICGRIIVTANSDCGGRLGSLCLQRHMIQMHDVLDSDRRLVIDSLQQKINIKLPETLSAAMVHNASLSPLDISLIMSMYANYSSENIRKIEDLKGSDINKINDHFYSLYKEAVADANGILCHVLTQISTQLGLEDEYLKMLKYVALSARGLSMNDLESLVPGLIPMKLRQILHLLKDIIYECPARGTISFINEGLASGLITDEKEKASLYGDLVRYVSSLSEDNPLREMLPLYAIREGKGSCKGLLASRHDTAYYRDIYHGCICHLTSDDNLAQDILTYCSSLNSTETIYVTTGIIDAMRIYDTISLHYDISSSVFATIDIAKIKDDEALYRYGLFYSNCSLMDKLLCRDPYEATYRSMEAFRLCFKKYRSYRDSKNMYKAMASAMMPLMLKRGESFKKIMKLHKYLTKL